MRVIWAAMGVLLALPVQAQPITAWCAGGATGGGGGTRIAPEGTVTRLVRARAGAPEVATPLGADPAAYARWHAALAAAGFANLPQGQPGNMTCGLSQGGAAMRWAGLGVPEALPEPVARVFRELRGWRPE